MVMQTKMLIILVDKMAADIYRKQLVPFQSPPICRHTATGAKVVAQLLHDGVPEMGTSTVAQRHILAPFLPSVGVRLPSAQHLPS